MRRTGHCRWTAASTSPTTPHTPSSLAALRWHGYRSDNRYLVFQTLAHTLTLPAEQWRVLDSAHRKRNFVEYEGVADVDEQLVAALLRVTREVAARVAKLGAATS